MASEINNYVGEDYLQYMYVLDTNYEIKGIIDTFSDLLWVERYCGYGEFEVTMPMNEDVYKNCSLNDYVSIKESLKIMIIESIEIHPDMENGDILKISGRSLESILDRRIIVDESIGKINDDGTPNEIGVQTAIETILKNNVIDPANSNRRISNFIFRASNKPAITDLTMETFKAQGSLVYDKILDICKNRDLGFRVENIDNGGFLFELYFGIDRTWDQNEVPAVIFSDSYENLVNSNYLETYTNYKSAVYISWSWQYEHITGYTDRMDDNNEPIPKTETINGSELTETYRGKDLSGLSRRETYLNDSDTQDLGRGESENPNKSAAINQEIDKGKEYLADFSTTEYFDGETEPNRQFVYGIDYFLGDVVQLENKYGKTGKCRITEIMRSRDSSGVTMVPTFESIEGDDE